MAGAHIGAGAALDAVHQVVVLGALEIVGFRVPVELLRQQIGRTHLGAGAAADARLLRRRLGQLFGAGGDHAVAGLDHRHRRIVQGKAHHRAAHYQAAEPLLVDAGVVQQVGHRGAQPHFVVAGARHGVAGHRSDA